ncbi:MAG: MerR family transcriptional regulator [Nostocoides sp.]
MGPRHTLSLAELADLVELPERTVRLYQSRGLIDPPDRRGRSGIYTETHVQQLRTVKALIARGFPLSTIADVMRGKASARALLLILDGVEGVDMRRETRQKTLLSDSSRDIVDTDDPEALAMLKELGLIELDENGRVRTDALALAVMQDLVELGLTRPEVARFATDVGVIARELAPVVARLGHPFPMSAPLRGALVNLAALIVRETVHTALDGQRLDTDPAVRLVAQER